MGQVNTVRGRIDAAALGTTLMHEHVFVRSPEVASNWPTGWDRAGRVAQAVERLSALKAAGIDSIVDLTVVGLGRDVELVQEVASQIDLNVVVATGLYTYNDLPHYFDYRGAAFRPERVDMLDEFFLHDIEEGIAGTEVRPGILKCATDEPGLTPGVERVLRAVARVHRRTGLPISTHTHVGTRRGLDQQRVFTEEGVDLAASSSATAATPPISTTYRSSSGRARRSAWTASASTPTAPPPTGWRRSPVCAPTAGTGPWCCRTTPGATWTGSTTTSSRRPSPTGTSCT